VISNDQTLRHTLDIQVGALGVPALGKGAQGGLHALKMDRIPKGWYSTQPSGVGANLNYRVDKRLSHNHGQIWPRCLNVDTDRENCLLDITFGYGAELGNVRTAAVQHATLRVGWGLTGFPSKTISVAAAPGAARKLEFGATAGLEGRAIAYTALVHATPGSEGFSVKHFVYDQAYGVYARYDAFRVTFQHVKRSPEFSFPGVADRSQTFGSIAASFEPNLADRPTEHSWLLRHWQLELGMGGNFGGPETVVGDEYGLASQLAARKGLLRCGAWTLNLGVFELAAATVQTTPTPGEPGNKSDLFLQQKAVTLGVIWEPIDSDKKARWGRFGLRAGSALWGGSAEIETIFHRPENGLTGEQKVIRTFDAPPGGWLAGAQYFPPLERHVSVGFDVAYHSVKLGEPVPDLRASSFWKAIVAVQVRP
jgi:hypothetical protein